MQRRTGAGDPFDFPDPFAGFGGLGNHRSLLSGFFGGRDPFDDPFFTRPFGGMFDSSFGSGRSPFPQMPMPGFIENHAQMPMPGFIENHAQMPMPGFIENHAPQAPQPSRPRGPIIEEITSDDEKEEDSKEKKGNPRKHGRSSKEPYVEDPDDEAEERKNKHMLLQRNNLSFNNTQPQPQSHGFSFQSSTVTYGGSNGAYYTSSTTRRTGSDGVTFEENRNADTTTGKASHRILRGIHDKGHSLSRKLNQDGKVDTMQTLHNLNEDELVGFETAWEGKAKNRLPGWSQGVGHHGNIGSSSIGQHSGQANGRGLALPSTEHPNHSMKMKSNVENKAGASQQQQPKLKKAPKKQ